MVTVDLDDVRPALINFCRSYPSRLINGIWWSPRINPDFVDCLLALLQFLIPFWHTTHDHGSGPRLEWLGRSVGGFGRDPDCDPISGFIWPPPALQHLSISYKNDGL